MAKEKTALKKSKPLGSAGEKCFGCGAVSSDGQHPIIGVINKKDINDSATVIDNPSEDAAQDGQHYVGVPVCDNCWKDPRHRTANPLKCHFFERKGNVPKIGLMLAGSFDLGG